MKTPLYILLAEDETAHAEAIRRAFETWSADTVVNVAGTLKAFRDAVEKRVPDIAIMDINLPDGRATEALSSPPENGLFPIVFMTSYGNEEIAVETMKAGALDYVVKSTESFADMPRIVNGAMREWDLLLGRKRTEEALKQASENWQATFDAINDIMMTLSPDHEILAINRAGLTAIGKTREEVIGKKCHTIIHNSEKPIESCPCVKSLITHTVETNEHSQDGLTYELVACPILDANNRITTFTHIVKDITDQKKAEAEHRALEEQLRQSQKLEAIGQLASGVAHDFNNLLGGIMGHAELLKMKLDAGSGLRHHADRIFTACTKAADLTRQLLSFARKAPTQIQDVDLNSVIKQVIEILERTIDRRIEIVVELQNPLPLVSGDANQLENALLNIAINARDAMPEGGRLRIGSKTVTPEETLHTDHDGLVAPGPYVMISIADTGTGMSSEIREHIFDPFFTTKEVGKGTGLGLASVYGCIKQHNGHITVQSQEGEGTQFEICIPVASTARPVADAAEGKPLAAGKGTLLVIDDEQVYHEVITETFQGRGYTVYNASDGADAVAFYREHQSEIDVVILDMNMPKMSGRECFRCLKKTRADVKVIVASGYGDNADWQKMRDEGALAFVQKPYQLAELGRKITELMGAAGS